MTLNDAHPDISYRARNIGVVGSEALDVQEARGQSAWLRFLPGERSAVHRHAQGFTDVLGRDWRIVGRPGPL